MQNTAEEPSNFKLDVEGILEADELALEG